MKASSLKRRQKIVTTSDISTTFDNLTTSKLFCRRNKNFCSMKTCIYLCLNKDRVDCCKRFLQ